MMALMLVTTNCHAGTITIANLDTDDIVIPVFDTNLGTLDSVDLNIALKAGSTNVSGAHLHGTYTVLSTNTRNNTFVSGFGGGSVTTASGSVSYSVATPFYSGGGLNVGGFNFATAPTGSHTHSVTTSYEGLQQVGPTAWRARANISTGSFAGNSALYADQTKALSFSGAGLTPFLGASDIVIGAGTIFTPSVGAHNHNVPGFSRTVSASGGPWNWFFSSSQTPSSGTHATFLDPRFDVSATFNFTPAASPVPEPTSLAVFGIGAFCIAGVRRHRQKNRNAPS